MEHFSALAWVVSGLSAFLIGVSKTGLPGVGILGILLAAAVLPARASTGLILPMLIVGDLFAVAYYRRHAVWSHLVKLMPCAAVGIVAGSITMNYVSDVQLEVFIGLAILAMMVLNWWWSWRGRPALASRGRLALGNGDGAPRIVAGANDAAVAPASGAAANGAAVALGAAVPPGAVAPGGSAASIAGSPGQPLSQALSAEPPAGQRVPTGLWFPVCIGLAAGMTTMMANAAGPIMIVYLVAMRLPKNEFLGTGAWYFLILNCFKVPFSAGLGLINKDSLHYNLFLLPLIVAGALSGVYLARKVPQKAFTAIVQVLALLFAVWLVVSPFVIGK